MPREKDVLRIFLGELRNDSSKWIAFILINGIRISCFNEMTFYDVSFEMICQSYFY